MSSTCRAPLLSAIPIVILCLVNAGCGSGASTTQDSSDQAAGSGGATIPSIDASILFGAWESHSVVYFSHQLWGEAQLALTPDGSCSLHLDGGLGVASDTGAWDSLACDWNVVATSASPSHVAPWMLYVDVTFFVEVGASTQLLPVVAADGKHFSTLTGEDPYDTWQRL